MPPFIAAALFLSYAAFALPENDLGLAHDAFRNLGRYATSHTFTGQAGLKIHSLEFSFGDSKSAPVVVVIPGRGESAGKYFELAYDLGQKGIGKVFALDHRGQGLSERLLSDPLKGYVDDFHFYVSDLQQWLEEVVLPASEGRKIVLVAHSMGGAIVTSYLKQSKIQSRFSALVLTSPMFGIFLQGDWLKKLAETSCKPGNKTCGNYIPGAGPPLPSDTFGQNSWTSSQNRYALNRDFYSVWPQAQLGGPTWGWLNQALHALAELNTAWPTGFPFPITLFQAGQEQIVDNGAEEAFCHAQLKCELVRLEGAMHSIFEEKDEWRDQAVKRVAELAVSDSSESKPRNISAKSPTVR